MLKPKSKKQSSKKQDEQDGAAADSEQGGPPKLPPHHPLATGQHSEPFMVLPSSEGSAASEGAVVKEQAQERGEDEAMVSPAESATAAKFDAAKSEPVSAVSVEHDKSLSLPETDGEAEEVKATGTDLAGPRIATCKQWTQLTHRNAAPVTSQVSTQDAQSVAAENDRPVAAENVKPVTAAENVKPTATVPTSATTTSSGAGADVPPATKFATAPARIIDEKMTVMAEEPPEIKTKAAAPGMSATSGPLDDFPMEGDKPWTDLFCPRRSSNHRIRQSEIVYDTMLLLLHCIVALRSCGQANCGVMEDDEAWTLYPPHWMFCVFWSSL
jgi:hypothetical protein